MGGNNRCVSNEPLFPCTIAKHGMYLHMIGAFLQRVYETFKNTVRKVCNSIDVWDVSPSSE